MQTSEIQLTHLIVFGAVRTTFNSRQFRVELLTSPDVELSRRSNKTDVYLSMNLLPVDVWTPLPHLKCTH